MNNNYIEHFENENIRFRDKIYKPEYSLKKADNLSKKILKGFNKNKKNKQTTKLGYDCISAIFQDLFWQYSFNYIKYKVLIKRFGLNLKVNNKQKERNTQKSVENCIRNDTKKTEASEEVQDIMQINYYGKKLKLKL